MDILLREKIFEKKFYVYELIDPITNIVFYVGKGQKYRCFTHEYKTRNGKIPHNNRHLFNKISKILESNSSVKYNIVYNSDDELACYEYEEDLIRTYNIQNLCNIELSNKGVKHTPETIQKIRESNTGKKVSEETKEKIRNINIGKKHLDESKKKVSDSLKEQYKNGTRKVHVFNHDEKWRESVKKLIGRKHSEESIRKMKEKHKGKTISKEQREKTSITLTMDRITISVKCEICESEFNVVIIKDGVNSIRKCCSRKCSAYLAAKTNKIKKDETVTI